MSSFNHQLHNKILSLPKSDFPSIQSSNNSNNINEKDPPLLLLSLPKTLGLKDLSSSQIFISDNNECRLINESKGITFDLIKTESSNAYVMFPPQQQQSLPSTSSSHKRVLEPPSKRVKSTNSACNKSRNSNNNNSELSIIKGRLLREKNTFFMECEIPSTTNLYHLIHDYLREYCIYPSSNITNFKSVIDLSVMFLYSQKEVCDVLKKMCAFPIPNGNMNSDGGSSSSSNINTTKYGVLSEETERDTWNVILSVLAEWEGGIDYAKRGVDLEEMVKMVVKQDGSMEQGVVHYCIKQCQVPDKEGNIISDTETGMVKLDPNYIARKLAHQLFNTQIAPWKQSNFLSEWHRLMPGVGKEYEPSIDLLAGIAIPVKTVSPLHQDQGFKSRIDDNGDEKENELYWKYFPSNALPSSDEKRIQVMFEEREKWTYEEVKPFFDDAKLETLLLKYTRRMEGENGSVWYVRK